jgi:hypothetical protein
MATFTKLALQPAGSTGTGLGIKVAATSGTGTAIHTASTTTTTIDEVWLYAVNTSASSVKLTLQFGGTTAVDNDIELTVLPEAGLVTIVPGLVLQGNATARVVRAFAPTADVIVVYGFVNRIAV